MAHLFVFNGLVSRSKTFTCKIAELFLFIGVNICMAA